MVTTIEDCGFFESIPLWAVTLIGGLFITILSFIMIMSVYGRFFKLYLYTAIAPIPLSTLQGNRVRALARAYQSYAAVCLEGAIIVLACIIFPCLQRLHRQSTRMRQRYLWYGATSGELGFEYAPS